MSGMRLASISRRLTLSFILAALVPLLAAGWAVLLYLTASEKEETFNKIQALSESLASQVDLFLQQPLASLDQIDLVAQRHLQTDPHQIDQYLSSVVKANPVFETLILITPDGLIQHIYPGDEDFIGTDMSRQPFFQVASASSTNQWSTVFRSPRTGKMTVTLSRNLSHSIVAAHLNLDALSEFTARLSKHLEVTAFIVDTNGTIIAHPKNDYVARKHNVQSLGIDPAMLGGPPVIVRRLDGEEDLFLSSRLIASTGWYLGIIQPKETGLARLHSIKVFLFSALFLAAVLAFLLALGSIKTTVRPLKIFSRDAEKLASGDYSLDLPASPYLEIEELRQAFAQMVDAVRQREALLRHKADEFSCYYELGLIGMAEIDPSGRWISVNPYLVELLQSGPEKLIGRSWWDLADAQERKKEQHLFAEVVAGRSSGYSIQKRFCLEESIVEAEVSVAAGDRDKQGAVSFLIAIIQDITEKKRTEATLLEHQQNLERRVEERTRSLHDRNTELAQSREEYAELYENAPDMYCTVAIHNLTITQCNQTIVNRLGRTKSELLGQSVCVLYPPEQASTARIYFAGIVSSGLVKETEQHLCCAEGSLVEAILTVSPTLDDQGQMREIKCCWVDISAQKRIEKRLAHLAQELSRSNEELQQFAYVASHDLQEPLRMIASYTQLLNESYGDQLDDRAKKFLSYAQEGAGRMQDLIEDLLAYSRVATRGTEPEIVALDRAYSRALANLSEVVTATGATITYDPLPQLRGDLSQLTQLLQNLVGNALKFHGPEPPRIHVGVEQRDGQVVFSVRDNGIGIDPRYASKIFTIFQRLHTRAEFPGTGIGLAICKRIVERHNGRIWFESVPGQSTTFFFTLEPEKEQGSSSMAEASS